MAALTDQAIKDAYPQILHVDNQSGGNGTTLVTVKDGDNGTSFPLQMSTNEVRINNGALTLSRTDSDVSADAQQNAVNVTGRNVVRVNASANAVVIGGFAGGKAGQILDVVVINATNNVTLKHAAAAGTQKIYLEGGADSVKTASFGGWRLYCDGTNFYQVS